MFGLNDKYLIKWGGALKTCEMRFYADGNFRYIELYGAQQIEFNICDVTSVTMNQAGMGKSIVKINGNGTALAMTKGLPTNWARSLKEWIEHTVNEYRTSVKDDAPADTPNNAFDALKKLKELKDLGIISENEYRTKREKMLELI
jgi:hypothetical protein